MSMLEASDKPAVSEPALPQIAVAQGQAPQQRAAPPQPPQLGIAHLMLWMACWGIYLGVLRRMFLEEPRLLGLLIVGVVGLSTTLSWAGLAVFLTRRGRRVSWPIEPGEWLLAALGFHLALYLLFDPIGERIVRSPHQIADALLCCFLVLPLFGKLTLPWKVAFGALLVVTLLVLLVVFLADLEWLSGQTLLAIWSNMFTVQSASAIATVWCAAVVDYRHGRRYGWLHALGLSVFVYYHALQIAFWGL
jgi:hypothetical protein